MYFDGYSCDATTLAENTFGDHEEGLSLTENTTIGQQIHHRNAWPTTGSLLEANYALDPLDPALGAKLLASKFDIDLTETTSPNYWAIPRYPVGNAWFKYVPAHVITEKCPPFSDPGGGKGERRLSITDENVIAGMQPVYDGFDATLWDAQVRAYRNLYENPQLRLEGSEAEAFYTANTETSYAQLAVILSRYDQALTTDSVILEQLGNLYAQAQEAQEAQSENLAALNQEIALLHGSVTDTRNEQLNSLQNDLAVVQVSAEYEINLKSVLAAIITSALSDSPWNWTNEQQAILQPIAAQCKLPGGYGVVLARLMLNQYDLEENCITENRNAQITSIGAINWRVSPNPTGGNLQISLPVSTNARTLDLYDQWGKKIKSQKLGTESAFSWDLSGLINGIYCLKLTGGKELYSVQRIVVQH